MIPQKKKSIWLEFVLPAAISMLSALIFKLDPGEIILGFWGASFLLGIVFCLFIAVVVGPYVDTSRADSRGLAFAASVLVFALLFFQSYTADLITKSEIFGNADNQFPFFDNIKMYLPFIILCVYSEIKNIFFTGLYAGQQFVRFFIVFARLQLIALACFYLKKYIPDILLYFIVYSISFFPIRLFEYDYDEED